MGVLEVQNLSHRYGDKQLFHNASFKLHFGEHMGVVGLNGAGKSTLLDILMGNRIADEGTLAWHPKMTIGFLDQQAVVDESLSIMDYLQSAFVNLYETEKSLQQLYEELGVSPTNEKIWDSIATYEDALLSKGFYTLDTTINNVASGLGITALGMDTKLGNLSGGQKAKVIIAKLLLQKPDVLIMDEPTNFLDKEHIEWLATFLKNFEGAFIIVSHHFGFLEEITNCICEIEFGQIQKYTGSYQAYLTLKDLKRTEYINNYEKQRKLIDKTEDYIARNKARASTAKMARGRQKMLDKIERIEAPQIAPKPHFRFQYKPVSCQTVLTVEQLEIGYTKTKALLPPISFAVKSQDRVVISGFNGIGKSTLLKTLMGQLRPLSGTFAIDSNIRTAYFTQELEWESDTITPLQFMTDKHPQLSASNARKGLAQCGIKANHVTRPALTLSGGEQAKTKMCDLMQKSCNLLILDEPTNHLDQDAKEALQDALFSFEGTVILVSHEPAFYQDWANKTIDLSC